MHPVQEDEGEKTYLKYSAFTFLFTNGEIPRRTWNYYIELLILLNFLTTN